MDPKPTTGLILAPSAQSGTAARLPGRSSFPSPEDHLVTPETTRDEMIRGRRVVAMPANPPHADRQLELGFVVRAHIKPGYVGSTELLTRTGEGSDFATDVCVRREGTDPATGVRYLEELAFEVVNEQSARDIREKAEDLTARGVRAFFAVFVKTGKLCRWSREKNGFEELSLDGSVDDPCLSRPLRARALLDAVEADDAVARALVEKHNPVIESVRSEGAADAKASAILAVLGARGVPVSALVRARITGCRDGATLDRWIARAAVLGSAEEVVAGNES